VPAPSVVGCWRDPWVWRSAVPREPCPGLSPLPARFRLPWRSPETSRAKLRGDVASVVTSRTHRRLLPAPGPVLAPAAATVGARYSLAERQDRWRKQAEIVQASANPAELQERITQALGTLPRDMPATAGMVAAKSSSIAAYLQERLGPMIPPQSPLQPNLPMRPIGRSDMAKWEGIWQAATNPRSVLVAWKAGRVTKDQVDTLRACWPRLFADLQQDAGRTNRTAQRADELRPAAQH